MIVFCLATATEYNACKRALSKFKNLKKVSALQVGLGPEQAKANLSKYLEDCKNKNIAYPQLVISTGFAGCLNSEAQWGSWVWASSVHNLQSKAEIKYQAVDESIWVSELPIKKLNPVSSLFVSSNSIISSKEMNSSDYLKRIGNGANPVVVDMESAALAEVCNKYGIAFSALRIISDTPEKPLPGFVSHFTTAISGLAVNNRERISNAMQGLLLLAKSPSDLYSLIRGGIVLTKKFENDIYNLLDVSRC